MNLTSKKLIDMIESHADELTHSWLKDVNRRSNMPLFHKHDQKVLYDNSFSIFSKLGNWIERNYSNREEIAKYFREYGRQRRQEGFSLPEIVEGLILNKRHVWLKVLSDGLLDNAMDLLQALELNNQVVLFFDRAIYYTTVGYENGQ